MTVVPESSSCPLQRIASTFQGNAWKLFLRSLKMLGPGHPEEGAASSAEPVFVDGVDSNLPGVD